jgi:hypothetical protein
MNTAVPYAGFISPQNCTTRHPTKQGASSGADGLLAAR